MRRFASPIRLAMCALAIGATLAIGIPNSSAAAPQPPKTDGAVEWSAPRAVVTCTAGVPSGVHFDFSYFAEDLLAGPYEPIADVELHPAGGTPAVQLGKDPVGVTPRQSGSFAHDYMITSAPGAGSTVELSVYLPTDASYLFIDQVVALTCPPPSSARPVLPDVDLTVTESGICTPHPHFDFALGVDASKATQPWTMFVYRIDKTVPRQVQSIQPGTSENVSIGRNVAHPNAFDAEVALVGPVRVDLGQFYNSGPLACPSQPYISLSSLKVARGGTERASVGDFGKHHTVRITLESRSFKLEAVLATIRTDADGSAQAVFTIPVGTSLGPHLVFATDNAHRLTGLQIQVVAAAPPSPPHGAPSLAETGTHAAGLTVLGLALILSGAGALVLGRRRRAM